MEQIVNICTQYFNQIVLGLFLVTFILLITALCKISGINKRYKSFMSAFSSQDAEKLIKEHIEFAKKVTEENGEIKRSIEEVKETSKSYFQKYGIVRYTAFEDVGSDLSFALALLDGKDDGVIINGMFSRDGSSVFAKPVHKGETKQKLSEEEMKALENAKRRGQAI